MSTCITCGKLIPEPNVAYGIAPNALCVCCIHDRRAAPTNEPAAAQKASVAQRRASVAELAARENERDCICKGNWRQIIKECEGLLGKKFRHRSGSISTLYGVVHADDDYYYGMSGDSGYLLLSCVGDLEAHGYTLIDAAREKEKP